MVIGVLWRGPEVGEQEMREAKGRKELDWQIRGRLVQCVYCCLVVLTTVTLST